MNKTRPNHQSAAGFTIIELMIATMIFSVILVAITVGVMHFTRQYYRGVYISQTQNAARNATEAITKAIQFGSSSTAVDTANQAAGYICAGGYVFVYDPAGVMYDSSVSGSIGLYMQPLTGSTCDRPAGTTGRKQLLSDKMRVAQLVVTPNRPHTITVTIAYGDTDLLTAPTGANVSCRSTIGSEYCAVSTITATATPRVTQ